MILDNCEHVLDAAAALAVRLLDAAPGLRILCTSQVPLDVDGEAVFELAPLALADAVELFTRRAAGPACGRADDAVHDLCRSLDGLPLAIELAAARTKTLSIEEITRRLDDRFSVLSDPTSRRPERRRALKATIRWSYELLFPDDQRGLWALATFAGGAPLPAVEFVLEALDVPASAAIDVVGRLASRSLVIVDDEGRPRYRLLDSIRAFALEAMTDAGLTERALAAHAAWFADAAGSSTQGVRSGRQAEHLAFARAERANIDAALAWSATHDPLLALDIVNGFGWAWIVLGDSRGAQRILAALDAAGDAAPIRGPRRRPAARGVDRGVDGSPRARPRAHRRSDRAGRGDRRRRPAGALLLLPRLRRVPSRRVRSGDGADRSQQRALRAGWTGRGIRPRTGCSPPGPRSRPATACAPSRLATRSSTGWARSTTRGSTFAATRCSASWPGIEHRFDDAVLHIGRAAETSGRLGFLQTEAYQLSSLGRAQCQAGDYATGAATLELAIEKAEATGDVRLAALARVHLGRVLRALGRVAPARAALETAAAWHRAAGGGEQAALGECLLAALDAEDRVPARSNGSSRSSTTPAATTTPPSRSSRSTRSPASPPTRATSPRRGTCPRRPTGAWRPPRTSSPSCDRTDAGAARRRPAAR